MKIPDAGKDLMPGKIEGRREMGTTEDEMAGWHNQLNRKDSDVGKD